MRILVAVIGLLLSLSAAADPVRVAVAANFAKPLETLVALYQRDHPDADIETTVASTGKLAAQIRRGAPFDIFLAADARRPEELDQEGLGVDGSRRIYAMGRLALWSKQDGLDLGPALLKSGDISPLALANPRLAPYGAAGQAVIDHLGLPDSVNIVQGENVGQAWHYASSGAAQAGFVAFSQVRGAGGSLWLPDPALYPAIEQQSLLLVERPAARAFYDFLATEAAGERIEQAGYGLAPR
ncbi:molybdate ABC transporter substrate-binding protein [Alloalcanivorax profundimaris]|uniref:Molybdate ABC transporter periplasmic binding protein n=1 Tax=Alloalcanivorax profundimaris TaxID=2735259 RepID=A0ABS0AMP8_9GAMM|nr:molybdate ABC transporter substrate-binding protein [Alloalcanivorax profundimaris]MBF1801479.1 molybdate ABC transporter substrate-binding protein [Alloalcanivorax profundimaris]MBF5055413.1 molybdate ABC transporter periplasmic binding protein [Alloalcanivorax profundimaris]MCQ6261634.1 molybdate ABC transporter substrate-binding protein [Alcanivorax sp. MM125-6]